VFDAPPGADAALAGALARSFWDDPLMVHLQPRERGRFRGLLRLYRQELREGRRRGRVLTTGAGGAAAVWFPPDRWRSTPRDLLEAAPMAMATFGLRLPHALGMLSAIERHHPHEPHWYLALLGAEPAHQGTGAAAALVGEVLRTCDAEGLPAYLESSKEQNLAYYGRFGFEVTGMIHPPGGSPPLWPMWREPRR
jgi:GNAT superfamily N-acetyltransferase